jgi:hypothetical protein
LENVDTCTSVEQIGQINCAVKYLVSDSVEWSLLYSYKEMKCFRKFDGGQNCPDIIWRDIIWSIQRNFWFKDFLSRFKLNSTSLEWLFIPGCYTTKGNLSTTY